MELRGVCVLDILLSDNICYTLYLIITFLYYVTKVTYRT